MASPEPAFLEHAHKARELLSTNLNEADTRANLVDPLLQILGYRAVGDVRREVPVPATREFIDYELRADGEAKVIIEAKALRHAITDQHAGQCVQYASVLGVRWCLITNGVTWALYDAHARGPLAEKEVAQVRLDGDELEVARAWSVLSLFARDSVSQPAPLTQLLIDRVVADELQRPDAPAIQALRRAVRSRFSEQVPGQAVLDAIRRLMSDEPEDLPIGHQQDPGASAAPAQRRQRTSSQGSGSLAALAQAELLPPDAQIRCKLYGTTYTAQVRDGKIEMQGKLYSTPSSAASILRGGKASNGWIIWEYKGEKLALLRERLRQRQNLPD